MDASSRCCTKCARCNGDRLTVRVCAEGWDADDNARPELRRPRCGGPLTGTSWRGFPWRDPAWSDAPRGRGSRSNAVSLESRVARRAS